MIELYVPFDQAEFLEKCADLFLNKAWRSTSSPQSPEYKRLCDAASYFCNEATKSREGIRYEPERDPFINGTFID